MLTTTILVLGLLLGSASISDLESQSNFENFSGEHECPTLDTLNQTTRYWHSFSIDHLKENERAQSELSKVSNSIDLTDLRTLEDSTDGGVCSVINTRFWGLHTDIVEDSEMARLVPAYYQIYYQSGEYYFAFSLPYSVGVEDSQTLGGPSLGYQNLTVFDEKLNLVTVIAL